MIWLANGASVLYQWERGVTVNCDKPCDVLSVWREDDKKAKRIVPEEVQGVYRIEIPRQLLQQSGYLRIEAIDAADDGERVIDTARIIIRPRKKPDDYPANGGEAEYWQSLNLRMKAIERKAREGDFDGEKGDPGVTPHVGANGNWYLGDTDTGVHASGVKGAPYIGANGNWWFNGVDSGVRAQGEKGDQGDDGLTPYIGENGNWWIGGKDTGMSAGMQAVGDIVETFRTDLGDDWLLCNGAGIPEGEFPVLRELMPYNTEWVEYTSNAEYEYIAPISNTHKWVRVKRKTGTGTDDYAWDKAEVFDAETREVLTVDCPLVVDGKTSRLYGITYDDVRYVLAACCLGEKTAGKLTLHYYKSDDLASWEEFYVTTIDENYNASDFAFDGEEYLSICGYVTTDSGSNYTRSVYATPSNLAATTKMPNGGGGYKEPRFRAVFPGYFYVPSGNYTYLYRAGTGEQVVWLTERPKNLVYFNDRYIVTVFDSVSLSTIANEIIDLEAGSHVDFKISTLLGYSSTTNVYGYGAEYEPDVNEWIFYYRESSNNYYEVRISADADPTDPAQYRVKKIKNAPSSTAFINQMSYNRANCDGYKFRDPSVKYLPESESNAYKYVYGGKEHVGKPVELEYIESTGMQYIDTGIKPNQNTKAVVDVQFTEFPAAHSAVFGANDTTNAWWAYYRYSDYLYRASAGGTTQKSIECTDPTVRTKITLQKGAFTVDDQTVTIPETDYNIDLNAYLFALNKEDAVDYPSSIKMYSCKIYDNDVLVRDYVPCRLASGVVCMYDRVSGEYAMKRGAGKFIAGAEVGVLEEETT